MCNVGLNYESDEHVCRDTCHTFCFVCTSGNFWDCEECRTGNFSWGEEICRNECPTGFQENASTKNCDPIADYELCITYDHIAYDFDVGSNVLVSGGAT